MTKRFISFVVITLVSFFSLITIADPVEFYKARGGLVPTGMGGAQYRAVYNVIVDNIAFEKEVGIWGETPSGWSFFPGVFIESVDGDREIWQVSSDALITNFAARYTVAGEVFWDNNNNFDYALFPGSTTVTLGKPNVSLTGAAIDNATNTLNMGIDIKNIDFTKEVIVRYTTDGWATFNEAFATFNTSHIPFTSEGRPNAETWVSIIPIGAASEVEFAINYRVGGVDFWDNNFNRNYVVTR